MLRASPTPSGGAEANSAPQQAQAHQHQQQQQQQQAPQRPAPRPAPRSANPNSSANSNSSKMLDAQQMHVCRLCDKLLSSSSSLDRHMLTHSGERPFVCKRCHMTFTTNGNMHRHMRTHLHKDSLARQQQEQQLKSLIGASVAAASAANLLPQSLAHSNYQHHHHLSLGGPANQSTGGALAMATSAALNASGPSRANQQAPASTSLNYHNQRPAADQNSMGALLNQQLVAALQQQQLQQHQRPSSRARRAEPQSQQVASPTLDGLDFSGLRSPLSAPSVASSPLPSTASEAAQLAAAKFLRQHQLQQHLEPKPLMLGALQADHQLSLESVQAVMLAAAAAAAAAVTQHQHQRQQFPADDMRELENLRLNAATTTATTTEDEMSEQSGSSPQRLRGKRRKQVNPRSTRALVNSAQIGAGDGLFALEGDDNNNNNTSFEDVDDEQNAGRDTKPKFGAGRDSDTESIATSAGQQVGIKRESRSKPQVEDFNNNQNHDDLMAGARDDNGDEEDEGDELTRQSVMFGETNNNNTGDDHNNNSNGQHFNLSIGRNKLIMSDNEDEEADDIRGDGNLDDDDGLDLDDNVSLNSDINMSLSDHSNNTSSANTHNNNNNINMSHRNSNASGPNKRHQLSSSSTYSASNSTTTSNSNNNNNNNNTNNTSHNQFDDLKQQLAAYEDHHHDNSIIADDNHHRHGDVMQEAESSSLLGHHNNRQQQQQQNEQEGDLNQSNVLISINGEIIEDISQSYVKTANPNAARKGGKRNRHCYKCKLCTYSSVDRCTLVRHLRIHSGERPYICGICRYAFTTKANCERHVRKRHKKQYNSLGGAGGVKGSNGGGRSLIITDHSNHQTIPVKVNPVAAQTISQTLQRIQEKQQLQQQRLGSATTTTSANNNNNNNTDNNIDDEGDNQNLMGDHLLDRIGHSNNQNNQHLDHHHQNHSHHHHLRADNRSPSSVNSTHNNEGKLIGEKPGKRRHLDDDAGDEHLVPYHRRRLAADKTRLLSSDLSLFPSSGAGSSIRNKGNDINLLAFDSRPQSAASNNNNNNSHADLLASFMAQLQQATTTTTTTTGSKSQANAEASDATLGIVQDTLGSNLSSRASATLLANMLAVGKAAGSSSPPTTNAATATGSPPSTNTAPVSLLNGGQLSGVRASLLGISEMSPKNLSQRIAQLRQSNPQNLLFARRNPFDPFNPIDLAAQALDLSCSKFQSSK